jgi:hypothetical protein
MGIRYSEEPNGHPCVSCHRLPHLRETDLAYEDRGGLGQSIVASPVPSHHDTLAAT